MKNIIFFLIFLLNLIAVEFSFAQQGFGQQITSSLINIPSYFSNDKPQIEKKVINIIDNLKNNLNLIVDKNIADNQRYNAINETVDFFSSETNTVSLVLKTNENKQRLIRDYLNLIKVLPIKAGELNSCKIYFAYNFIKREDGNIDAETIVFELFQSGEYKNQDGLEKIVISKIDFDSSIKWNIYIKEIGIKEIEVKPVVEEEVIVKEKTSSPVKIETVEELKKELVVKDVKETAIVKEQVIVKPIVVESKPVVVAPVVSAPVKKMPEPVKSLAVNSTKSTTKDITKMSVEELKKYKAEVLLKEDFDLAGTIKDEIYKRENPTIEDLEKLKQEALAKEDFEKANEYKEKIAVLKNKNTAQTNVASTNTSYNSNSTSSPAFVSMDAIMKASKSKTNQPKSYTASNNVVPSTYTSNTTISNSASEEVSDDLILNENIRQGVMQRQAAMKPKREPSRFAEVTLLIESSYNMYKQCYKMESILQFMRIEQKEVDDPVLGRISEVICYDNVGNTIQCNSISKGERKRIYNQCYVASGKIVLDLGVM